jgi:hypothetical protein
MTTRKTGAKSGFDARQGLSFVAAHRVFKKESLMKYQKGEVMLVMMAVILVVMWAWNGHMGTGHMGMMAHGSQQAAEKRHARQQGNSRSQTT